MPLDDDARAYFTSVEEHFVRRRGQALLLSPADVARVAGWHRDGVPVEAIHEGIDMHFDRLARRGRPARRAVSLAYIADDVLDAWAGAKRRRLGRGSTAAEGEPASLARPEEHARLVAALEASATRAAGLGEEAAGAVSTALAKLRRKADLFDPSRAEHDEQRTEDHLRRLDKSLQEALRAALGDDRLAGLRREADQELGPRRDRMTPEAVARVTDQLVARRVRETCDLPRLSLFYT